MPAPANLMIVVPTALDTYLQAQGTGASPLNAGLALYLPQFQATTTSPARTTGLTINTVANQVAYQGDIFLLNQIWEFLKQTYQVR